MKQGPEEAVAHFEKKLNYRIRRVQERNERGPPALKSRFLS